MASATRSELIGARLKARFSDWFSRLRDASEIRSLSAADLDSFAHDLRVWRTEFETLVVRRRQGAAELPKLLKTHGMEEMIVARKEPGVLHDMTLLCALCVEKSHCNCELEPGTAVLHQSKNCASTNPIEALGRQPKPDPLDLLLGPCCC